MPTSKRVKICSKKFSINIESTANITINCGNSKLSRRFYYSKRTLKKMWNKNYLVFVKKSLKLTK